MSGAMKLGGVLVSAKGDCELQESKFGLQSRILTPCHLMSKMTRS